MVSSTDWWSPMTEQIEVTKTTKERFDREKATVNAADANLPDLTDDQFVNTLLDTLKEVEKL